MALEALTISVGAVADGFQPFIAPGTLFARGKTWIIASRELRESCVIISCPEMDAAELRSWEDAEHTFYYQRELDSLRTFAQEDVQSLHHVVQDIPVLMMPPSVGAKKHLLMARQAALDGTGAETIGSQPTSHRIPL